MITSLQSSAQGLVEGLPSGIFEELLCLQEARGGEEGQEVAAPVGRIRLQDRQAQQPQPAAASPSQVGAPRVVFRDGRMVVDEQSLVVQAQVPLVYPQNHERGRT